MLDALIEWFNKNNEHTKRKRKNIHKIQTRYKCRHLQNKANEYGKVLKMNLKNDIEKNEKCESESIK